MLLITLTDIKIIIKECYEKRYAKKLDNPMK